MHTATIAVVNKKAKFDYVLLSIVPFIIFGPGSQRRYDDQKTICCQKRYSRKLVREEVRGLDTMHARRLV
jgi:hypothetical protein